MQHVPLFLRFSGKANRILWKRRRTWSTVMAGIGWQAAARIA
jgi:hypothetical protein